MLVPRSDKEYVNYLLRIVYPMHDPEDRMTEYVKARKTCDELIASLYG